MLKIVGQSGTGKSTLMDIVMGLIPVKDEHILINGAPISEFGRRNFYKKISFFMGQHTFLISGSIKDNFFGSRLKYWR